MMVDRPFRRPEIRYRWARAVWCSAALLLSACSHPESAPPPAQVPCADLPDPAAPLAFPTDMAQLGHLPEDVCPGTDCNEACPDKHCDSAFLDRLHQIYAWRVFIAANWPYTTVDMSSNLCVRDLAGRKLQPAASFAGPGSPLWSTWPLTRDLFSQGQVSDPPECKDVDVAAVLSGDWTDPLPPKDNPVWDQNGNLVEQDTRLNPMSFNGSVCIVNMYQLPNQDPLYGGCAEFGCAGGTDGGFCKSRLFWGRLSKCGGSGPTNSPAANVKLAWKKLAGDDDPSRFILRDEQKDYGLVAMHIATKNFTTRGSWLWATFEHIDNLEPPDPSRKPLFRDPTCKDCIDNKCPPPGQPRRTQIKRVMPIPDDVAKLNQEVQGIFAGQALANYQLIGVQRGNLPADEVDTCARSGKTTGGYPLDHVEPKQLTNAIIEWDRQDVSCMGCHGRAKSAVYEEEASCTTHMGPIRCAEGCADFNWQAAKACPGASTGEPNIDLIRKLCDSYNATSLNDGCRK
jgi:hypothetical protein